MEHDNPSRLRPAVIASCAVLIAFIVTSSAFATEEPAAPGGTKPDGSADLAKKLQNPVAALISVPFRNNFECGSGPRSDGFKYTLNFQLVISTSISEDWSLISRTIVPIIHQDDVVPDSRQGGLGDILQSAFFSPKAPE